MAKYRPLQGNFSVDPTLKVTILSISLTPRIC